MQLPKDTSLLRTPRTTLRPFAARDVADRAVCGEDPEIVRMFGGTPAVTAPTPLTMEAARDWYAQVTSDPNPLHWAIEFEARFIGTVRLHTLDENAQRARYAIGILDRSAFGRGLGTEITQAVLGYGFTEVGLHRIDLRVLAFNQRAIRCYQRCGFVEEGRERESALIENRWHDDVIMSVLAHEWREPA